ncbi:hypothetical protein K469DRAFT_560576 [Zopfia rhizophila CBS 207.26]|uniref:Uncharacterized protein n=1 Tax=Zopfia rhizophila CBS 207.26 TaxID=1314779 RepID=A0A6A6EHJ2_9PEZI|nr:hypothetical protein K469DRAFT_560576 [Zopfia rhizophila CBS 207.26]
MASGLPISLSDLRIALAHAVGYPDYPGNDTAAPYLNYISNRHIGRGTLDEYLTLFLRVVEYFKDDTKQGSIQELLDEFAASDNEALFSDTKVGGRTRKEDVEDTVMYILGVWCVMLSSFVQLPNGWRKVTVAYERRDGRGLRGAAYEENLSGLLKGNDATRLNAFTLSVLAAVEISWTQNISRHMLLSQHGGRHVLEVFALPCVFNATFLPSDAVGISSDLAQEIQESYCILFNAWPETSLHAKLGLFLGLWRWCWCWSCSAYRYRTNTIHKLKKTFTPNSRNSKRALESAPKSEFDPLLVELMNNEHPSDWTYELFPCLWPRITMLEEHLQRAKPWSIWILFRDRRDTLQFWTFFFATLVVMLTFLQVALGIAQVVGSFV